MSVDLIRGESPAVYVASDRYGHPLYVGATRNISRRLHEHQSKDWWALVGNVEVYPQADWTLALFIERNMIRRLSPEFNQQSADPDKRRYNRARGTIVRWIGGFGE